MNGITANMLLAQSNEKQNCIKMKVVQHEQTKCPSVWRTDPNNPHDIKHSPSWSVLGKKKERKKSLKPSSTIPQQNYFLWGLLKHHSTKIKLWTSTWLSVVKGNIMVKKLRASETCCGRLWKTVWCNTSSKISYIKDNKLFLYTALYF